MSEIYGNKTLLSNNSLTSTIATIEKIRELIPTMLRDIDLSEPSLIEQTKESILCWVRLSLEKFLASRFIYNTSYPELIAELVKVVRNEDSPNKIDVMFPTVDYVIEYINITPALVAIAYQDFLQTFTSSTAPDQLGRICTYES